MLPYYHRIGQVLMRSDDGGSACLVSFFGKFGASYHKISYGFCGSNSAVESLPSKQVVAGSNPVSRSSYFSVLLIFLLNFFQW